MDGGEGGDPSGGARPRRGGAGSWVAPVATVTHVAHTLTPELRRQARDKDALPALVRDTLAEGADANARDADGNTHVERSGLTITLSLTHATTGAVTSSTCSAASVSGLATCRAAVPGSARTSATVASPAPATSERSDVGGDATEAPWRAPRRCSAGSAAVR